MHLYFIKYLEVSLEKKIFKVKQRKYSRYEFFIFLSEYWDEIVSQLNFTEHQKKTIQKYKNKFVGEKIKFEKYLYI